MLLLSIQNVFLTSVANSVDPDQTPWMRRLIWVYNDGYKDQNMWSKSERGLNLHSSEMFDY